MPDGFVRQPVLSVQAIHILQSKNRRGYPPHITAVNPRTGKRHIKHLPTDPTRAWALDSSIPEYLNSRETLDFIGFDVETKFKIWDHYLVVANQPQSSGTEEHHLLRCAKVHIRTSFERAMDADLDVGQTLREMGLGADLQDVVMNYCADVLNNFEPEEAEEMMRTPANLQIPTLHIVEARWDSLADLDAEIVGNHTADALMDEKE